jgi:hypothetical protein
MSYYINTFDDGNITYMNMINIWNITSWWKGKVSLQNATNPLIIIQVISYWKITAI